MDAISCHQLRKLYVSRGRRTEALRGIDLSVDAGRLFSFLGKNGAGKTTFVKIASTLLLPTSGQISVMGYDAVQEAGKARELLAVVPQGVRPYWHLTPREHIYHYLRFRGAGRAEARDAAQWMVEKMGMESFADTKAILLSGGQRQRTMVAAVLATMAPVLFLDEPTIGMDPVARRQVWTVIEEIRRKGSTIFLTTHYLDEAERLSEQIAVINEGRVLYSGDVDGLKRMVGADYRVVFRGEAALGLEQYGRVVRDGTRLLVLTDRKGAMDLAEEAARHGVEISVGPVTLEEAFLQLAGGLDAED